MTLQEHLAVPYILAMESYEGADGEWLRRASFPELPGCVVEGFTTVDLIQEVEELRVRRIMEMLQEGEQVPVPRPPLPSAIQNLNREQLEFARWLVEHGHLTD